MASLSASDRAQNSVFANLVDPLSNSVFTFHNLMVLWDPLSVESRRVWLFISQGLAVNRFVQNLSLSVKEMTVVGSIREVSENLSDGHRSHLCRLHKFIQYVVVHISLSHVSYDLLIVELNLPLDFGVYDSLSCCELN